MKFSNSKHKKKFPSFIKYLLFFLCLLIIAGFSIFFVDKNIEKKNKNFLLFNRKKIKTQQQNELLTFLKNIGNTQAILFEMRNIYNQNEKNNNFKSLKLKNLILKRFLFERLNFLRKIKFEEDISVLPFEFKKQNWLFKNYYRDYQLSENNSSWIKEFYQNLNIKKISKFFELRDLFVQLKKNLNTAFLINRLEVDTFYETLFKNLNSTNKKIISAFFDALDLFQKKISSFLTKSNFKKIQDWNNLLNIDSLFTFLRSLNVDKYNKNQKNNLIRYQNLLILAKQVEKQSGSTKFIKTIKEGSDINFFELKYNWKKNDSFSSLVSSDFLKEKTQKDQKFISDINENLELINHLENNIYNKSFDTFVQTIFTKFKYSLKSKSNTPFENFKWWTDGVKFRDSFLAFYKENNKEIIIIFLKFLFPILFINHLIENNQIPSNVNETMFQVFKFLLKLDKIPKILNDSLKKSSEKILKKLIGSNDVEFLNTASDFLIDTLFKKPVLKYAKKIKNKFYLRDTSKLNKFLQIFVPKVTSSELKEVSTSVNSKKLDKKIQSILNWINLFVDFQTESQTIEKNIKKLEKATQEKKIIKENEQKILNETKKTKKSEVLIKEAEIKLQEAVKELKKVQIKLQKAKLNLQIKNEANIAIDVKKNQKIDHFFNQRNESFYSDQIKNFEKTGIDKNIDLTDYWYRFFLTSKNNVSKKLKLKINKKIHLISNIFENIIIFFSSFFKNFFFKFNIFSNWNFLLFLIYQILLFFKVVHNNDMTVDFFKNFKDFLSSNKLKIFLQKIFQFLFKIVDLINKFNISAGFWNKNIYNNLSKWNANKFIKIFLRNLGYIPSPKIEQDSKIIPGSLLEFLLQIFNFESFPSKDKSMKEFAILLKQKLIGSKNIFDDLISTIDKYLEKKFYFYLNSENWEYKNIQFQEFDKLSQLTNDSKKEIKITYLANLKNNKIPFKFKFTWKIHLNKEKGYIFSLLNLQKTRII